MANVLTCCVVPQAFAQICGYDGVETFKSLICHLGSPLSLLFKEYPYLMVETYFHSYLVIDYNTITMGGGIAIFKLFSMGCRDHTIDQGCHNNPL